jgi:hypothetical protein
VSVPDRLVARDPAGRHKGDHLLKQIVDRKANWVVSRLMVDGTSSSETVATVLRVGHDLPTLWNDLWNETLSKPVV